MPKVSSPLSQYLHQWPVDVRLAHDEVSTYILDSRQTEVTGSLVPPAQWIGLQKTQCSWSSCVLRNSNLVRVKTIPERKNKSKNPWLKFCKEMPDTRFQQLQCHHSSAQSYVTESFCRQTFCRLQTVILLIHGCTTLPWQFSRHELGISSIRFKASSLAAAYN